MKKAQSAIEFFILIGAVVFIFLAFLFVIKVNISGRVIEDHNRAVYEIAAALKNEIELASESIDGYHREFELPQKVAGRTYSIQITDDGSIYINTDDGAYALSLPVEPVSGDPVIGQNYIRKENGAVYLNEEP